MELRKFIATTIREYLNEQVNVETNINNDFWNWFKNSEVVDKSGNPLIVNHGSKNKDFNQFSITNDIGFHFAVSKNIAKDMSGKYTDDNYSTHDIEPLNVYLSIQKLGGLPDLEFWRKNDLIKALNKENEFYRVPYKEEPMKFVYNDKESLLDNIKQFSFEYSNLSGNYKDIDGFVYYNEYEGRFTKDSKISYIVLKPNQIKSIKNDGTWDINDNNIYS
jgi:hypothetical protein